MMIRLVATIYLVLLTTVCLAAFKLWRIYCENFGCTGVGIAWAAWVAVLYVPVLLFGWYVVRRAREVPGLARLMSMAVYVQLLVGAGLVAYWLHRMMV